MANKLTRFCTAACASILLAVAADHARAEDLSEDEAMLARFSDDLDRNLRVRSRFSVEERYETEGPRRDAAETRAVVNRYRSSLRRCWEVAGRGMQYAPTVRLSVAATVDTTGSVRAVAASGAETPLLAACVEGAVSRWRFTPSSHMTTAAFPIVFTPGS